jgi:hypothetical protein
LFPAVERTGGRTDMTKLTVAFRSFEKAPKNIQSPNVLLIYMNEAHDYSSTSQRDFCPALAEAITGLRNLTATTRASKIACS